MSEVAVKKGRKSWQPYRLLNVYNKKPGIHLRWVENDPNKIEKRLHDGYEFVNATSGTNADVPTSNDPTSAKRVRDLVLMACPQETADERNAYFKAQADIYVDHIHRKNRPQKGVTTHDLQIERIS